MLAMKKLFRRTTGRPEVDYSAHSAMVQAPPPGRVTDRHDPNHEVWKPQSACGDQSAETRIAFFNSGLAVCPACGERNVWRFEEKAGVRDNGDLFGTDRFTCRSKGCGWKTSFLFDDGSATSRYYETVSWPRGVHYFPTSFLLLWSDKHDLGSEVKHQIFEKKLTGNQLAEMEAEKSVETGLGVRRKDADKIYKALGKANTAVLTRQATKKK